MIELNQTQLLYRIQFRFILDNPKSPMTSKLFHVYVKKWSILMKYILSNRTFELYSDLHILRKLLHKDIKVTDIIEKYSAYLNKEGLNFLIEAQPLFNISPIDLKAFVLAVIGLRSYHIKPSLLN